MASSLVECLMNESETLLVERARSGDRAAFEDLVRRTSRLVFSKLYLECGDAGQAEDLLQETYLLALRSIRGITDAASFRSWLLAIARNALIADARKSGRLKRAAPERSATPLAEVPAAGSSPTIN